MDRTFTQGFEKQCLDKNKTDSETEVTLDGTGMEDDMTEHTLVPLCQGVHKQGQPSDQSDMGVMTSIQMTILTMN
jgi:hypothetical protein